MIRTSRQLKDLIKNKSKGDSRKAQLLIRIYCMERFLERLSLSQYRENFIIKGGMLVSSMIGTDRRTTMDLDTTIKGRSLSVETARDIVSEIINVQLDDCIRFELLDAHEIMDDAEYAGVRLSLAAWLDKMKTPIKIDISTGDVITPREIRYEYQLMFEDRAIDLLSYNLLTILAEKIETVISRGAANTRLRDFYDIYALSDVYSADIDWDLLKDAIYATSGKRGSETVMEDASQIISELGSDDGMRLQWKRYQKQNEYAADVPWEAVIERIIDIGNMCHIL